MPLIHFKPDYERGSGVGSKEKIFLEQYDWLLRSALNLTRGQRERAEDLVHDLFVQFQVKLKSLEEVADLRAYLYGMLRNLYASQLRSASRHPIQQLSILDHDSISVGLRAHDFSDQLQTLSSLTRACEFVCHRKETTLKASVFILRYFHCYYPDEIVLLLGTQRVTVDKWLSRGRAEAKQYLADPYPIPKAAEKAEASGSPVADNSQIFLAHLRGIIFASCATPCQPVRRGKKPIELSFATPAFGTPARGTPAVGIQELAHLVSCASCLNKRSRQLGLPGLEERTFEEPHLRDDHDSPPKGGGGTGIGSGNGAGINSGKGFIPSRKQARASKLRKGYARTRELLKHYPTELSIAVDGHIRTSHVISSSVNLLNLTVDAKERIEFIEILSEQGMRFLLLDRDDLETVTPRRYDIVLSDGRVLEIEIVPDVPGPCIQVAYRDPGLEHAGLEHPSEANREFARAEVLGLRQRLTLWEALRTWFRTWFSGVPGHVRIFGGVLAASALLALSTFLWQRPERGPVRDQVLQQVMRQEQALPVNAAAHRIFHYEEDDVAGHPLSAGQVEMWRKSEPQRVALRFYDAQHKLVSGLVRDAQGRTEYGKGTSRNGKPDLAQAWQNVPSAEGFASLASSGTAQVITHSDTQYRLVVHSPKSNPELIEAALVVDRKTMRAVEADYELRDGKQVRLRETSYEVRTGGEFDSGVFDVGRDFDKLARHSRPLSGLRGDSGPNTAALELQVLSDLMQAGASAGEQLEVHRDRQSGTVEVRGVVDTPERKAALLQAVASLAGNPYLRIALRSSDELPQLSLAKPSKRKRSPVSASPSPVIALDTFQATSSTIPADEAIRAYLKTEGISGEQLDNAVRSFASEACAQSLQAQQHAYRLAQLAAEFSPSDLAQLDAASRLRWLVLINNYSEALDGDLKALRNHLEPVIKSVPGGELSPSNTPATESNPLAALSSPAELAAASRTILSQTARLNQQVQSAFSITARSENTQSSNSRPDPQLAGNGALSEMAPLLNAAESMAGNVSATAQHLKLFAANVK